ncbi:MAG: hypothetical protein ACM35F_03975 [Betaproteobacteria bacterium]
MSNIKNAGGSENVLPAMSKINRLQQRALRLQQEAQQARERLREEEALQEKLERLRAHRKGDQEMRQLGVAAWIAGLRGVRLPSPVSGEALEQPLDYDLLIGAMTLLREQLFEIANTAEVVNLRVRGEAMRKDYFSNKSNQKFSVNIAKIQSQNIEGDNHEV